MYANIFLLSILYWSILPSFIINVISSLIFYSLAVNYFKTICFWTYILLFELFLILIISLVWVTSFKCVLSFYFIGVFNENILLRMLDCLWFEALSNKLCFFIIIPSKFIFLLDPCYYLCDVYWINFLELLLFTFFSSSGLKLILFADCDFNRLVRLTFTFEIVGKMVFPWRLISFCARSSRLTRIFVLII